MSKLPTTRDEIKKALETTVDQLRSLKADIRLVRAQAAAKGRYAPVAQYHSMLAQEDALVAKIAALNAQLSHMPNPMKDTFAKEFMVAARKYLDTQDFENIATIADMEWVKKYGKNAEKPEWHI